MFWVVRYLTCKLTRLWGSISHLYRAANPRSRLITVSKTSCSLFPQNCKDLFLRHALKHLKVGKLEIFLHLADEHLHKEISHRFYMDIRSGHDILNLQFGKVYQPPVSHEMSLDFTNTPYTVQHTHFTSRKTAKCHEKTVKSTSTHTAHFVDRPKNSQVLNKSYFDNFFPTRNGCHRGSISTGYSIPPGTRSHMQIVER